MAKRHITTEACQQLRAEGLTNAQIALRLGCSYNTVCDRLNPKASEVTRQRNARNFEKRRQREAERQAKARPLDLPENPTIEDYMLPRQRVKVEGVPPAPEHPTLTGRLLGDPRPGRSALDKLRSEA